MQIARDYGIRSIILVHIFYLAWTKLTKNRKRNIYRKLKIEQNVSHPHVPCIQTHAQT